MNGVVTLSFRFQVLTEESNDNMERNTVSKNCSVNRRFHVSDNCGLIFDFIESHEYCSLSFSFLELSLSYPKRIVTRSNHETVTLLELGITSHSVLWVTQEE